MLKALNRLKFNDGTSVEILRIIGGPMVIDGTQRDTLLVEMRPEAWTGYELDEVATIFSDVNKTKYLRFINRDLDEEYEIGYGYCKMVSCNRETRKVYPNIGSLYNETTEEVVVVLLAQLTYQEMESIGQGESTNPGITDDNLQPQPEEDLPFQPEFDQYYPNIKIFFSEGAIYLDYTDGDYIPEFYINDSGYLVMVGDDQMTNFVLIQAYSLKVDQEGFLILTTDFDIDVTNEYTLYMQDQDLRLVYPAGQHEPNIHISDNGFVVMDDDDQYYSVWATNHFRLYLTPEQYLVKIINFDTTAGVG